MNNIMNKNIIRHVWLVAVIATGGFFLASCDDSDTGAAPIVERVSLVHKDSTTLSGGRGETLAIFGQNLSSTREVYFSGVKASLNTTMVTNTTIIITVPNAPFPGPNVLSTVRVVTNYGEAQLDFAIEQPLPVIYSFAPAVANPGDVITIQGQYFNNLEAVEFIDVKTSDALVAEVISYATNDEGVEVLAVKVPDNAPVSFIAITTSAGTSVTETSFGLNYAVFTEGLNPDMQNWSWGGADVFNSQTVAKSGLTSYKRTFNDGWSGVQLHHGTLDLTQFTHAKFSVFGGPGTTGKKLNFTINWGSTVEVDVVEGEWRDYVVPLSALGTSAPTVLDNFIFQDNGNTSPSAPYLIYLDDIGFL